MKLHNLGWIESIFDDSKVVVVIVDGAGKANNNLVPQQTLRGRALDDYSKPGTSIS